MSENHSKIIASQAGVELRQVETVKALLDKGATIPFIARYRKEKTGLLDEVVLGKMAKGDSGIA